MNVVFDAYAAIWYPSSPKALSSPALHRGRKSLENGQPTFLPAISVVGTIYLVERERLPLEASPRLRNAKALDGSVLFLRPLDESATELVRSVPRSAVPGMPDRGRAARAVRLGLPLFTRDRWLPASGSVTIW